jgi:leucyl-tRNA synthetase
LLDRIEKLVFDLAQSRLVLTSTLKLDKITRDYHAGFDLKNPGFHVAVARVIELFNLLKKEASRVSLSDLHLLLQYLYPFAPSFSEDMWAHLSRSQGLPNYQPVSKQRFLDRGHQADETAPYSVMLNSKRVDNFNIPHALLVQIHPDLTKNETVKLEPKSSNKDCEAIFGVLSKNGLISSSARVTQIVINNKRRLVNVLYSKNN